jgi:hypothetical protein
VGGDRQLHGRAQEGELILNYHTKRLWVAGSSRLNSAGSLVAARTLPAVACYRNWETTVLLQLSIGARHDAAAGSRRQQEMHVCQISAAVQWWSTQFCAGASQQQEFDRSISSRVREGRKPLAALAYEWHHDSSDSSGSTAACATSNCRRGRTSARMAACVRCAAAGSVGCALLIPVVGAVLCCAGVCVSPGEDNSSDHTAAKRLAPA